MPWFRYERVSGYDLPVVTVRLCHQGRYSQPIKFLIDSGASMSCIPRRMVRTIVPDLDQRSVEDTPLVTANGNRLQGVPVDFDMELIGAPTQFVTKESILVLESGTWGLLGQTWFERIGVNFQNFPRTRYGRRFALYLCPA